MLATAAAILFAIAQAWSAQSDAKRAAADRRRAAAALSAQTKAEDAFAEALDELDRVRAQAAEQLATYHNATERAHTDARTELEEVRAAAAKAVSEAQEAATAAIQKAIVDRDRMLAEGATDMRQQIVQANADAQAKVKILQDQLDAAKTEAEQLVKAAKQPDAEPAAELGEEATVTHRRAQKPAAARPRGRSGHRTLKMTPELVDKAQRMYNSHRFTVADIAQACSVSPTTIYRHIRTGQTGTR